MLVYSVYSEVFLIHEALWVKKYANFVSKRHTGGCLGRGVPSPLEDGKSAPERGVPSPLEEPKSAAERGVGS